MGYPPSRRLIIATSAIAGLAVALILLLPEIARRVTIGRLENVITVPVSIADVDLNLFTGRAHLKKFIIGDTEQPVLRLPAVSLRFSRTALLTGRINVEQLVLQKPALAVERIGPDRYNLFEILKPPKTVSNGGSPSLSIDKIEIQDGEVAFVDRTQEPDYQVKLVSFNLTAGPVSTLRQGDDPDTGFRGRFKIGNGAVAISGTGHRFQRSRSLAVKAEVSDIELKTFQVYLPYGGKLNLKDSLVNGHARYLLETRAGKTNEHSLNANLTIGGFGLLADSSDQPIVVVSGLEAEDIRMDFLEGKAVVRTLMLGNPVLRLERDAQGWSLARLFESEQTTTASKPAQSDAHASARMALTLQQVVANNGTIEFIDRTVIPAVAIPFRDARIEAGNVSLLPRFTVPEVVVNARVKRGILQLAGAFDGDPLVGQFTIAGKTLPFDPFRGYLNRLFGQTQWNGDTLSGNLKLGLVTQKNHQVATEISGTLTGQNLNLRFPGDENPFLSSRQLALDFRTLRLGENPRVDIEAIKLAGAHLRVVRNHDGSLNLSRLWVSGEKLKSKSPGGELTINHNNGDSPLVIRRISVEQGAIDIRDIRISPNYHTRLSGLSAQISELSEQAGRARLQLQGILGESARLTLSGWLTPFTEKTNMHLEGTVESYALPPLNPYATEYVSHRIERGQVTMKVDYDLKEGEFEANANLVLRNVRVGERTGDEFSRRIGIPLELAVALLEDINGVIRLNLAVDRESGPQFNVASLIWTAVRNALVRAISAPFRLIGRVFTLDGRIGALRVEPILFEPGMLDMRTQSTQQLEDLSKLLREKPQLELRLIGTAGPNDVEALKQRIFWEHIRAAKGNNYQEALVNLYKNLGGVTQPVMPLGPGTETSLELFVMERIEIAPEKVAELARNRAELVRNGLVERGVDPDRLVKMAQTETAADTTPRVRIELAS
jgi:uncharacterized protein involved in outer membrane biogenesis